MTSSRPYLLRAMYEWIVDNGLTPHLVVDTRDSRVKVPEQFIKDDSIVLNVAPGAVRDLLMANDMISFGARFGGRPYEILLPVSAVKMIYARENGQGMALAEEESDAGSAVVEEGPNSEPPTPPPPPRGSHLKRVK